MSDPVTLERLAAANPAPSHGLDIDDIALRLAIEERSVAMSTSTENAATKGIPPLNEPPPPSRRGLLIAVAAFIVVGVVGAVSVMMSRSPETPPASTPPSTAAPATTVATAADGTPTTTIPVVDTEAAAFIEALANNINRGDHQAAAAQIDGVSQINRNGYIPGVEGDDWTEFFRGMYEYWTLVDSQLSVDDCQTSATSGLTRCGLTRESAEAFPRDAERLTVVIRVDSGQLTYYEQGPDPISDYWRDHLAFDEWLYATTRDEDPTIYQAWFSFATPTQRAEVVQQYGPIWAELGRPRETT